MTRHTSLSRRGFLKNAGILGCSLAASPLVTPVSLAATPGDHRLVVIVLRGGMDGLDLVRPVGDPLFADHRPNLSMADPKLPLTDFYALHPAADKLHDLWTAGELAFGQAVSTPYRDKRSHFDGQDILEAGVNAGGAIRDGWLNRLVQTMPDTRLRTALAVGREDLLILSGDAATSGWSPDVTLPLTEASRLLMARVYEHDPLFSAALDEAVGLTNTLHPELLLNGDDAASDPADIMSNAMMMAKDHDGINSVASFTAEMLKQDTRIASFSIGGWDTHVAQPGNFKRALGTLQDAIMTLKADLGATWGKTTVLAMTEFGRTVRQNGSKGTDHGTGGTVIVAGGAVRGGKIYGDWPGLAEEDLYNRRDLMPTADIRLYAAAAMRGLFNATPSEIEGTIFPGLDLSPGLPKIIA
ncbi:DUF1501 domain-containing protein [Aliiroseovarius sp. PrR006]|uniref:DUF1501 domain-containing protein n=1 Tax=Aliiroseovarius sp. PrR006 TaxID=2706883 RepID=UPI0013D52D3C|nr:DUF1501 domain-containing protein [Aliiroseovarius sp. PrR006]NDW53294.1 DUF1501 domain-containing protein [Aliiroseovarius sp. PrR006]